MAPDVSLTVLNNADKEPVVYVGIETALDVTLTNNSDAITLASGCNASALKIFMPVFFTAGELGNMDIVLNNWNFVFDSRDESLNLTYRGPAANWSKGRKIDFRIRRVKSNSQPNVDSVQINFLRMGGSVPSQVQTPLSLSTPPRPGNASLLDVLQVSLDNQ